jgi:hypothetical protein
MGSVSGSGRTIDISSFGVLFESAVAVNPGDYVDLRLDWPIPSSSGEKMCLALSGYVIRARAPRVAVSVSRYDLLPAAEMLPLPPQPAKSVFAAIRKRRGRIPEAQPFSRAAIIIIEERETAAQLATMLARFGHPIIEGDASEAVGKLKLALRTASLIVTNTLAPFLGSPAPAPIIYTGPDILCELPPELVDAVVALKKPFMYGIFIKTAAELLKS